MAQDEQLAECKKVIRQLLDQLWDRAERGEVLCQCYAGERNPHCTYCNAQDILKEEGA